jgi:O-antigen ligase
MKTEARTPQKTGQGWLYGSGAAFFIMVLLAPNMLVLAGADSSYSGEGSAVRQIGYLGVLIATIYAALRQGNGSKSLILPWPTLLMLAWCWVSLAWSVNADVGARRLTLTSVVIWNIFIIVQAAGYERTVRIMRISFVATLIGSYAAVVLNPSLGVHTVVDGDINTALVGNWRGLLGHKNIAGAGCAMTIILFLYDAGEIKKWIRWAVILAAAYFLFRTQSKTSAGMLGIALLCGWIFQRYDDKVRAFAIPIIMFLTAIVWFLYNTYQTFVTDNFLNPKFFTGRGFIWSAMFRYAGDHLVLGSGFGSFWNVGTSSPIFDYGQGYVRTVATGHSGYLDLLVSIGLPGVLLVVFACIVWPVWQLLTSRIVPQRGALAIAILLFGMGHNITESSLLERDALVGVMMMVAVAIAQNWERAGTNARKKVSGADLFASLAQRRREHA